MSSNDSSKGAHVWSAARKASQANRRVAAAKRKDARIKAQEAAAKRNRSGSATGLATNGSVATGYMTLTPWEASKRLRADRRDNDPRVILARSIVRSEKIRRASAKNAELMRRAGIHVHYADGTRVNVDALL